MQSIDDMMLVYRYQIERVTDTIAELVSERNKLVEKLNQLKETN